MLWLAVAGPALFLGLDYYLTPIPERAFASGHELFAPHAPVGHGLGIVGSGLILVGVAGYSARRRFAGLRSVGRLRDWLDVHIFLCTLGPFLVVLHTSFKLGGLIAISFWSMVAVVLSGIFGRYVYVRIPKTVHGDFLDREAVAERRARLEARLRDRLGAGSAPELAFARVPGGSERDRAPGILRGLWLAIRYDLARRRVSRRISSALATAGVPRDERVELTSALREQVRLGEQLSLLRPFQQLFRYWHLLHLPLALVMLIVLLVHVAVAIAFGYVWVFG